MDTAHVVSAPLPALGLTPYIEQFSSKYILTTEHTLRSHTQGVCAGWRPWAASGSTHAQT